MSRVIAGRYAIQISLGRGGMGEVFLAQDQLLQRRVAIKEILSGRDSGLDPVSVERLIREARLAAGIQHPHVVAVHDLIVESGQTYIVMEYLEAQSLAEMIRTQTRLDPTTVARIGSQVAGALEAAHRSGIIHRDVKPSNILIDAAGNAKLADFGIARGSEDSTLTGTGMLIGSIAFMAPEVAKGEPASPAADIFSLGCTLYAATEGHAPFIDTAEPTNGMRALVRLISQPAPAAEHAGPLTGLLARMLAQDLAARPAAGELQRRLAAISVAAAYETPAAQNADGQRVTVPDAPSEVDPTSSSFPNDTEVATNIAVVPPTLGEEPGSISQPIIDPDETGNVARTVIRGATPASSPTPEGQPGTSAAGPASPAMAPAGSGPHVHEQDDTMIRVPELEPATRIKPAEPITPPSETPTFSELTEVVPAEVATPGTAAGASHQAEPSSAGRSASPRTSLRARLAVPLVLGAAAIVALAGGGWYLAQQAPRPAAPDPNSSSTGTAPTSDTSASTEPPPTSAAAVAANHGQLEKLHSLKFGGSIGDIALDLDHGLLYGADCEERAIRIVEASTGKSDGSIEVKNLKSPYGVAYSAGTILMPNTFSNKLTIIDAGSREVRAQLSVGSLPEDAALDQGGTIAVVPNNDSGTASIVDLRSNKVVAKIHVGETPVKAAVTSGDGLALVVTGDGLAVISLADKRLADTIDVGSGATGIALDEENNRAYVTAGIDGQVSVVDLSQLAVVGKVDGLASPSGIAVDEASHLLFVGTDEGITVVDTDSLKALGTTKMAPANEIQIDRSTHTIYALESFTASATALRYTP